MREHCFSKKLFPKRGMPHHPSNYSLLSLSKERAKLSIFSLLMELPKNLFSLISVSLSQRRRETAGDRAAISKSSAWFKQKRPL